MKTCTRCGQPASIWGMDLATGVCRDCLKADRAAEERRRLDEEARWRASADEQLRVQEARRRKETEARLGRCPECGGPLHPIQLFGRGPTNPLGGAAIDAELSYYTDEDAQRSLMHRMFTESGFVLAAICSDCRRIVLRGQPKS
ncbi:MAG TPA: hypothetical protein VF590_05080 [Isosphaeraceae bacterium]|jgi:hypothetical protein